MIVLRSKSQHGIQAGAAVVHDHRCHHERQAHDAGGDTSANRVGAQRRANGPLFDHSDARGQRAGAQVKRQICRLLVIRRSRDPTLIGDSVFDPRRTQYEIVEHYGEPVVDVCLRKAPKALSRILREYEIGLPLAGELALLGLRVPQVATCDDRRPGEQPPGLFASFARPSRAADEFHVGRQDSAMVARAPRRATGTDPLSLRKVRAARQSAESLSHVPDRRHLATGPESRLPAAASALLHAGFGNTQGVHLLLHGGHRLRHSVLAQLQRCLAPNI